MKKWSYGICPAIMLAVFVAFYIPQQRRWNAEAAARTQAERKAKEEEDAKRAAADAAARIAAQRRAADQKREEAEKEQERIARWDAESRAIQAVTDRANAEAAEYNREAAQLEIDLDTLRKQKEQLNREDFDLVKQVELARTRYRTDELDIQRMVTMLADRADRALQEAHTAPARPGRRNS